MVARANRGMAQAYLSVRREPLRVPRDHLSQPVHSGARSVEEGTAGASSTHTRYAPLASLHAENCHPRKDCRSRLDQRWEGDMFFGSGNSQIATLVEPQT